MKFVTVFLLCFVSGCLSKPTAESDLTKGRSIGSTLWGWLTYPFSWWSSEPQLPPVNDQLIGSTTTYAPQESIEIGKHNVTVWCNDQTCTTMKCDKLGCRNITCNIYDTNLMGECREYNNIVSLPEELVPKPTESIPKPVEDKVTENPEVPDTTEVPATSTRKESPSLEEHPLELEAVLSSTVNGGDKKPPGDKVVLNTDQKV